MAYCIYKLQSAKYQKLSYPEYSVDVNTTGWARMIQLKPLIQAELRARQKAREREGQVAQGLYMVIIFHLAEQKQSVRELTAGKPQLLCGTFQLNKNQERKFEAFIFIQQKTVITE